MCGYNFLADGKSKAGSVFLMCDKKVKESRQILGGDSAASVLHTDGQKVTVKTERDFDRSAGRYNKSRQQSITNELLDIVGGSMA